MCNKLAHAIKRIQVTKFNYNKTKRYKYCNLLKMGSILLQTLCWLYSLLNSSSIILSGRLLFLASRLCHRFNLLLKLNQPQIIHHGRRWLFSRLFHIIISDQYRVFYKTKLM